MLPNLDRAEKYLLLPSVLGAAGLLMVLVEFERAREGIIDVFGCLTLDARAKEACVGVVIAAGRPDWVWNSFGVNLLLSPSWPLSRDSGRALDVSSWCNCLARLLGAMFSRRSSLFSAVAV